MVNYSRPGVTTEKLNIATNGAGDAASVIVGLIGVGDSGLTEEAFTVTRSAASDDTDFVVTNLSEAEVSYRGYTYTPDVDFEITTGGEIDWQPTTIEAPYLLSAVSESTTPGLAAGTYYYKVTAIKRKNANPTAASDWGETTVSNEKSITFTSAKGVRLQWVQVPQAEGYRIYRGTSSGGETKLAEIFGEVNNFLDMGVYTPSGAMPTSNDAYRKPPYTVSATNATFYTGAISAANTTAVEAIDCGSITFSFDGGSNINIEDITFTSVATFGGAVAVKAANIATILQAHIQEATGTNAVYYGGDASLNLTNLQAVQYGRVTVAGRNLVDGDFKNRLSATNCHPWTLTGTDWTVTSVYKAVHTPGAGTENLVYAAYWFAPVLGAKYRVKYTIDSITLGGGAGINADVGGTNGATRTATGTYTEDIVAGAGGTFSFESDALTTVAISNISVCRVYETGDIDLRTANDLNDVATLVQAGIRAVTSATETFQYNQTNGNFYCTSDAEGFKSRIIIEAATTAGKTDLAAASYLYFTGPGYEVPGAKSSATVTFNAVTSKWAIASTGTGSTSSVTVSQTAGAVQDLWLAANMNFENGALTAGVNAYTTTYSVNATYTGGNYFTTGLYFTIPEVEAAFGVGSELATYAEKMLLTPPSGQGAKILAITGVPAMTRATARQAMTAQQLVNMDLSCIITDDVDIIRDHKAHCVAMSTPANKKERIGYGFIRKTMKVDNIVSLATELASDRYVLVYDNASTEDNIAPLVAAFQAAQPKKADSILNLALSVEDLNDTGTLSDGAVDYLLANGVMVCSYNSSNVFTVIDDVTTAGWQYDVVGTLTDDTLQKGLRTRLNSLIGRLQISNTSSDKLTNDAIKVVKNEVVKYLSEQSGILIDSYDQSSIVVSRSTNDRYKLLITYSYYRLYTLKRIESKHYVI